MLVDVNARRTCPEDAPFHPREPATPEDTAIDPALRLILEQYPDDVDWGPCQVGGHLAWILLPAKQGVVRLVAYTRSIDDAVRVVSDRTIELASVRGLAIRREKVWKTVVRERAGAPSAGDRLARGLAGAVTMGPVGGLLGLAGIGAGRTPRSVSSESVESEGPPTLVLDVDDEARPVETVVFRDDAEAAAWAKALAEAGAAAPR